MLSLRNLVVAVAALVVGLVGLAVPDVAHARWLRAESPRFIVYSNGDERTLREDVQNLETFDRLLRALHGLPLDEAPPRKFHLYLVGSNRDMEEVWPGVSDQVYGFYSAGSEDIFAIGIRQRREDYVILHEYVHHFMIQNFPYAYPGWLIEVYAEYFMGAEFERDWVTYGDPQESRGGWLIADRWLPLRRVVGQSQAELDEDDRNLYYAQAWALTHWFMSSPERRTQLHAYMRAVGEGEEPVPALEQVTGQPIDAFEEDLRDYVHGSLPYNRAPMSMFPPVDIRVTELPASADSLILLNQRQRIGIPEARRDQTLDAIRDRAARHGEDPFALLVLGHAELHLGDATEGERILHRLLEIEPDNAEALQLLASARYEAAQDAERAERVRLLNEGNRFLARALEADPDDYRTYYWLGLNREGAADYPTPNDISTWAAAYELAPQLSSVRLAAARALMLAGRFDEAIDILGPVANHPHGRETAVYARQLITLAEAGQPPIPYTPPEDEDES
jgi:tetratricopeptide (TPR) repeat protein